MNHRERVEAVVSGGKPDRTPVMFSGHFPAELTRGEAAIASHVDYFRRSGNDICKVMNENQQRGVSLVNTPADLRHERLSDASRHGMREQAAIIAGIKDRLGDDVPVI